MEKTLDQVIKTFKQLIKQYEKDSIERNYYEIIVKYLLLEHKHQEAVLKCGKPIYHYFKYSLPVRGRDYFEWLYNPHNPVRFALETFDSVEEIRIELGR
jgi:hypothetical protein